MKATVVIVDLQFGSTGKGLLSGFLAQLHHPDTVVAAWAPNAGHTWVGKLAEARPEYEGKLVKLITTMLPIGSIAPSVKRIMLGPGSVINPDALQEEISYLEERVPFSISDKLFIHPNAAVVSQEHRDAEAELLTIGSTRKGSGAAFMAKVGRRELNVAKHRKHLLPGYVVAADEYDMMIDDATIMHVEGAQGFSLGVNQRFYPHCTYRECTLPQVMVDCGIPLSGNVMTMGSARTYPIRVGNRFDSSGAQVGYSGDCYPGQRELDWSELGVTPELTTVTKVQRRVFTFSTRQIAAAIRANGQVNVFLNFCNYLRDGEQLQKLVREINKAADGRGTVAWLGFGPSSAEVVLIDEETDLMDVYDFFMSGRAIS